MSLCIRRHKKHKEEEVKTDDKNEKELKETTFGDQKEGSKELTSFDE